MVNDKSLFQSETIRIFTWQAYFGSRVALRPNVTMPLYDGCTSFRPKNRFGPTHCRFRPRKNNEAETTRNPIKAIPFNAKNLPRQTYSMEWGIITQITPGITHQFCSAENVYGNSREPPSPFFFTRINYPVNETPPFPTLRIFIEEITNKKTRIQPSCICYGISY